MYIPVVYIRATLPYRSCIITGGCDATSRRNISFKHVVIHAWFALRVEKIGAFLFSYASDGLCDREIVFFTLLVRDVLVSQDRILRSRVLTNTSAIGSDLSICSTIARGERRWILPRELRLSRLNLPTWIFSADLEESVRFLKIQDPVGVACKILLCEHWEREREREKPALTSKHREDDQAPNRSQQPIWLSRRSFWREDGWPLF